MPISNRQLNHQQRLDVVYPSSPNIEPPEPPPLTPPRLVTPWLELPVEERQRINAEAAQARQAREDERHRAAMRSLFWSSWTDPIELFILRPIAFWTIVVFLLLAAINVVLGLIILVRFLV